MWLVMQVLEELEFERENYIKVKLKNNDNGLFGMLPVFNTKEQAEKLYPNSQLFEVILGAK